MPHICYLLEIGITTPTWQGHSWPLSIPWYSDWCNWRILGWGGGGLLTPPLSSIWDAGLSWNTCFQDTALAPLLLHSGCSFCILLGCFLPISWPLNGAVPQAHWSLDPPSASLAICIPLMSSSNFTALNTIYWLMVVTFTSPIWTSALNSKVHIQLSTWHRPLAV